MELFAKPLRLIADYALPPRCPGCGAIAAGEHRFCAACWQGLRFLGPPWCGGCAEPFEFDRGEGALCGHCLADPPVHAGVRAAVAYGPVARSMVLRLKYGGRTGFAETAARLMARHVPADAHLLVPVPLHRWRIWSRGFNQSALIAAALSRLSGVQHAPGLLERIKPTPPLRGLGRKERAQVTRGAFGASATLPGEHVVLIDDVHTSGATSNACARALLKAGAGKVTILCWARVLQGDDAD